MVLFKKKKTIRLGTHIFVNWRNLLNSSLKKKKEERIIKRAIKAL